MTIAGDTTFILRKPSGKILMQLRDNGKGRVIRYSNMWCFPGGSIKPRETPLDCVVREIEEEYGISMPANDCQLVMTYTHDHSKKDFIFICKVPEEIKIVCNEGKMAS